MRYRDYKIFRAHHFYHLYNRGTNKEPIFKEEKDYLSFLKRLKLSLGITQQGLPLSKGLRLKALPAGAFDIICYCLMPNHFHFLIRQNTDVGIEKLILKVCTSYVMYFNKKYSRVGQLFQDSFKAKLVDNDSYLTYLSAYIHRNPENFEQYDYSSFKDYLALRSGKICKKSFLLNYFKGNSENCLPICQKL